MTPGGRRLDVSTSREVPIRDVAEALHLDIRTVRGSRAIARCVRPERHAHRDRTPSLGLNFERNRFRCFGCGLHGDSIELVEQAFECSFVDAVSWLANRFRFGDAPTWSESVRRRPTIAAAVPSPARQTQASVQHSAVLTAIHDFVRGELGYLGEMGHRYLVEQRGLRSDVLAQHHVFEVREVPDLLAFLQGRFRGSDIVAAGLAHGDRPELAWDSLAWRLRKFPIVLPHLDDEPGSAGGPALAYAMFRATTPHRTPDGRLLKELAPMGLGAPRPFNAALLRAIAPSMTVYVCEGAIDALSLMSAGYQATIALPGVAYVRRFAPLLREFHVVCAFDGDRAGRDATRLMARCLGRSVLSIQFADGQDANSWLRGVRHA